MAPSADVIRLGLADLNNHDIICSKRIIDWKRIGNTRYHNLCLSRLDSFASGDRYAKKAICDGIISELTVDYQARFVKKIENGIYVELPRKDLYKNVWMKLYQLVRTSNRRSNSTHFSRDVTIGQRGYTSSVITQKKRARHEHNSETLQRISPVRALTKQPRWARATENNSLGVHDYDVLCQRGRHRHKGNLVYRQLCLSRLDEFHSVDASAKKMICLEIIDTLAAQYRSRFIKVSHGQDRCPQMSREESLNKVLKNMNTYLTQRDMHSLPKVQTGRIGLSTVNTLKTSMNREQTFGTQLSGPPSGMAISKRSSSARRVAVELKDNDVLVRIGGAKRQRGNFIYRELCLSRMSEFDSLNAPSKKKALCQEIIDTLAARYQTRFIKLLSRASGVYVEMSRKETLDKVLHNMKVYFKRCLKRNPRRSSSAIRQSHHRQADIPRGVRIADMRCDTEKEKKSTNWSGSDTDDGSIASNCDSDISPVQLKDAGRRNDSAHAEVHAGQRTVDTGTECATLSRNSVMGEESDADGTIAGSACSYTKQSEINGRSHCGTGQLNYYDITCDHSGLILLEGNKRLWDICYPHVLAGTSSRVTKQTIERIIASLRQEHPTRFMREVDEGTGHYREICQDFEEQAIRIYLTRLSHYEHFSPKLFHQLEDKQGTIQATRNRATEFSGMRRKKHDRARFDDELADSDNKSNIFAKRHITRESTADRYAVVPKPRMRDEAHLPADREGVVSHRIVELTRENYRLKQVLAASADTMVDCKAELAAANAALAVYRAESGSRRSNMNGHQRNNVAIHVSSPTSVVYNHSNTEKKRHRTNWARGDDDDDDEFVRF